MKESVPVLPPQEGMIKRGKEVKRGSIEEGSG